MIFFAFGKLSIGPEEQEIFIALFCLFPVLQAYMKLIEAHQSGHLHDNEALFCLLEHVSCSATATSCFLTPRSAS